MTNPRNGKNKRHLDQDFYSHDVNAESDHESDRNVFPKTVNQAAGSILDEIDFFDTEQKTIDDLGVFDSFFTVQDEMDEPFFSVEKNSQLSDDILMEINEFKSQSD